MNKNENEYLTVLNRIRRENNKESLNYFMNTTLKWHKQTQRKRCCPSVVLIGPDLPEEIIAASGISPYWILGGSHEAEKWADDFVPRDTDPVSRSICGYLHEPNGTDFSKALIVISLSSDSMRKIADQLKREGRKVLAVDVPSDRTDKRSMRMWNHRIEQLAEKIGKHAGKSITGSSIRHAEKDIRRARLLTIQFLKITGQYPGLLTETAVMMVVNSYYYQHSIKTWSKKLLALINELKSELAGDVSGQCLKAKAGPGILLMGSPVYFPNYKVPELIRESKMRIASYTGPMFTRLYSAYSDEENENGAGRMIRRISESNYKYNSSGSFVSNDASYKHVLALVKNGKIDGVIYHILKGQIECDFELERFEKFFEEHDIPVFRLETDYQYQDVEQLRIRLEAFSEMLSQRSASADKEKSAI